MSCERHVPLRPQPAAAAAAAIRLSPNMRGTRAAHDRPGCRPRCRADQGRTCKHGVGIRGRRGHRRRRRFIGLAGSTGSRQEASRGSCRPEFVAGAPQDRSRRSGSKASRGTDIKCAGRGRGETYRSRRWGGSIDSFACRNESSQAPTSLPKLARGERPGAEQRQRRQPPQQQEQEPSYEPNNKDIMVVLHRRIGEHLAETTSLQEGIEQTDKERI